MSDSDNFRTDGTCQQIAYDGNVAVTNAFGAQTYYIRIVANSACHYNIAKSPTAATTDPFLPANWIEVVKVTPGQKIAAIKAATNGLVTATAGTLSITELSR